ncbi:MAG TPA: type IV CRISPR-associated protein Csf1 [Nevskiaceae bacterium]|nr:type IV CRISPR-associated protein Csf1 [Nevskiaceae bacterium]
MTIQHATELVCEVAGLKPLYTSKAEAAGHCAWCARHIEQGARCSTFIAPVTFNDWPILGCLTSSMLCGWCRRVQEQGKPFMQTYGRAVVSRSGFFAFASNNDRAAFFVNPPKPPFIVVNITAQQQHIYWKAPVNFSRDLLRIQFGDRLLTIRRQRALDAAADIVNYLTDPANHVVRPGTRKAVPPRFPISIDRDLEAPNCGEVSPDVPPALRQTLGSLTTGELFALTCIVPLRGATPAPAKLLELKLKGE